MTFSKPKLDAREVMLDIRAGLRDEDLMTKYRLSAEGLKSLFDKLIAANLLSWEEIDARQANKETTPIFADDEQWTALMTLSGHRQCCHKRCFHALDP